MTPFHDRKFVALHANTAVQGEQRGIEQIEVEEVDESMKKMYARRVRQERRKSGYGLEA